MNAERTAFKKQSSSLPFASSLLLAGSRKVIRLTSLDRSGSANILKNTSYSNLWPFGSIINSAKTRGSQTVLPDRRKFLVFVMFAFCLAVSLVEYKQRYHSPSTPSDSETYIFIANVLSPLLFHTVSDSRTQTGVQMWLQSEEKQWRPISAASIVSHLNHLIRRNSYRLKEHETKGLLTVFVF